MHIHSCHSLAYSDVILVCTVVSFIVYPMAVKNHFNSAALQFILCYVGLRRVLMTFFSPNISPSKLCEHII